MYRIVERQKKKDERSELHTESCLRSFAWKTWLIAWSSGSLFNERNTRGGRTNDSYREKNWIFRLADCVTGRGSYRNDVGIFARLWIINKPAAQETVNRCISVNLKRDKREHRVRGKKREEKEREEQKKNRRQTGNTRSAISRLDRFDFSAGSRVSSDKEESVLSAIRSTAVFRPDIHRQPKVSNRYEKFVQNHILEIPDPYLSTYETNRVTKVVQLSSTSNSSI